MAITKPPIRNLRLDFLASNISGYEKIVKISFVKEPGFVGNLDLINIDKYVIDKDETETILNVEHVMKYIGNGVYMTDDGYMGGLILEEAAKDKANLKIITVNLKDFRYLLDFVINPEDLVIYALKYVYRGTEFKTPIVTSYTPIEPKALVDLSIRPCLTLHNQRFRGTAESFKTDQFNQEKTDDMRFLYSQSETILDDIEEEAIAMDNIFNTLYNITDRISMAKTAILD